MARVLVALVLLTSIHSFRSTFVGFESSRKYFKIFANGTVVNLNIDLTACTDEDPTTHIVWPPDFLRFLLVGPKGKFVYELDNRTPDNFGKLQQIDYENRSCKTISTDTNALSQQNYMLYDEVLDNIWTFQPAGSECPGGIIAMPYEWSTSKLGPGICIQAPPGSKYEVGPFDYKAGLSNNFVFWTATTDLDAKPKLFKANLKSKQATWVSGILPENTVWLSVSEELSFGLNVGTMFNPQLNFYRVANTSLEYFPCRIAELQSVARATWDFDKTTNRLYQAIVLKNRSTALVEVDFDAKKCSPIVLSLNVSLSNILVLAPSVARSDIFLI